MSDILTQEEINALLAAFAEESGEPESVDGRAASDAGSGSKGQSAKPWDFRRPERFSKEQLRTLQMLHETYARYVSTSLSALLRFPVKVSLISVQQSIYEEFMGSLQNPSVLYIFGMLPLDGSAILEINSTIAFVIIDRLLGGPGKARMRPRELTEIEQTLMQGTVERILKDLGESWQQLCQIDPKVEGYETNPQFAQIVPPNDPICLLTFEVKVGDAFGSMSMCIPYSVIRPITSRLSAQRWFMEGRRSNSSTRVSLPPKGLDRVKVPVKVCLGGCEVSMRDVLGLEVGDIVKLDSRADDALTFLVGDLPKFRCVAGREGKRLAVQIVGLVSPEEVS